MDCPFPTAVETKIKSDSSLTSGRVNKFVNSATVYEYMKHLLNHHTTNIMYSANEFLLHMCTDRSGKITCQ